MCLIIASQQGIIPDDRLMKDAYDDNPHGWGIMWAENGRINVVKGMRLKSMIRNVRKVEGKPYVLHTRWATHGKIGVSNCHPFKVTDDLWLAHNGVITGIDCWKKEMSDTWHFARALRDASEAYPFILEKEYGPKLAEYVEKWIGYRNKIVMLRSDGEILIANESAGVHYEGMWLSNTNSLWINRYPESWHTRHQYKPSTYQDALAAFASDGEVIDYLDEQQCDYCMEVAKSLYRWDGCDICSDCHAAEVELLQPYREQMAEYDRQRPDDGSEMDEHSCADIETGLEDDDDEYCCGTELDREIARIRGEFARDLTRDNVVAIDRGNYRLEEVPFSTVN